MADMLVMLLFTGFCGAFWAIGEWLSHGETEHLCSDGNVKPGLMQECACRADWMGLA